MILHVPVWLVAGWLLVGGTAILVAAAYVVAYLAWEVGKRVFYCGGVWQEAFRIYALREAEKRNRKKAVAERGGGDVA